MAYEEFRARMNRRGTYMGAVMRSQSESLMNATWMNSLTTYPVVVHSVDSGLPPIYKSADDYIEPLYAHFEVKSTYNVGGNEPAYYLIFQPHVLVQHPEIKVGSYVNIPSVDGICNYWLIVHQDDDNELIKCQVLKGNWTLKWVSEGVVHQSLCVVRSGTSENIGIETVGQLSTVDSSLFIWMPSNNDAKTITYDSRFLISDEGRKPALAWKSAKIRDVAPIGITRISLAQDLFNPLTDNDELMLANYNPDVIDMTESNNTPKTFAITYNGTKPTIKVGNYKNFTAQLPTDNNCDIVWSVIDGETVYSINSYDNIAQTFSDYTLMINNGAMQLKVAQNYNLVGKVLTIQAKCTNNDVGNIQMEVIS